MNFEIIFSLIATVVSFLFFLSVFEQYFRKRKVHQLIWSVAIFFFFVTTSMELISLIIGFWNPIMYKIYYVLAAVQVSFMGGGVFYLLASRDIINRNNVYIPLLLVSSIWFLFSIIYSSNSQIFLIIMLPSGLFILLGVLYPAFRLKISVSGYSFSNIYVGFTLFILLFLVYQASISNVNVNFLSSGGEVSGLAWQMNVLNTNEPRAIVRLFSPFFTVTGTVGLVGGPIYSYFAWQKAIKNEFGFYKLKTGVFNLYIAIGALILAAGGILSGLGFGFLYISEVLALSLMYFGFLESDKISMSKLFNILSLKFLIKSE